MNDQRELSTGVPAAGSLPLGNGRHERFAQACLSQSQADSYRQCYPASQHWKAASVQTKASLLAAKVQQRVQWLRAQAADEEIISLIEVKKLLSGIIRDGSEATMARLAGVDRLMKIECWDEYESPNKQTNVVFNFKDDKGRPLI